MADIEKIAKEIATMKSHKVIENKLATLFTTIGDTDIHVILTSDMQFEAASYEIEHDPVFDEMIIYVTYIDYSDSANFIRDNGNTKKVTLNYTAIVSCGQLVHEVVTYCPHLDSKVPISAVNESLERFNEIVDELGLDDNMSINRGFKMTACRYH